MFSFTTNKEKENFLNIKDIYSSRQALQVIYNIFITFKLMLCMDILDTNIFIVNDEN